MEITLTPKQSQVYTNKARTVLAGGSAGGGKALNVNTKIPTPDGWKTMGELAIGNKVFDENGLPCNVVAVTEVMHNRPCYKIKFSDDTEVICDEQHQWVTMTDKERIAWSKRTPEYRAARRAKRPSRSVLEIPSKSSITTSLRNKTKDYSSIYLERPNGTSRTTIEILDSLHIRGNRKNHSIDLCKPVQYPKKDLIIDPWLLGLWLGDGTGMLGQITTADEHNIERIKSIGYKVSNNPKNDITYTIYGLQKQLRKLGVLGNKHTPRTYLESSIEDRINLLHGLMDSDGFASNEGKCVFYNTNKRIIDDFIELAKSLGINTTFTEDRATLYGKDCGPAYNVYLNATFELFSLPRRKERQKISKEQYRRRYIVSIELAESVPVKCIQVDSPRNMYLCSESFIPTHNSLLIRALAIQFCLAVPGLTFYIFRSSAPQLRSTFFEGGLSFPALLSEMIEQGYAKINHNEMTIKFTHNGSMIKHRHMSTLNDADDIQGVELAACAVDEASLMPEQLLRWMIGRRRIGSLKIPEVILVDNANPEKRVMLADKFPFMLLTSNPGSVSGAFLKKWFIDPAPPMTEFVSDPDFGEDRSVYLPFGMKDNPHLDKDYEKTLLAIGDPVKIRQMRDGDWSAQSATLMGHAFSRYYNIIKSPVDQIKNFDIYRSFDHGFSAPAAVVWIGTAKEKIVLTCTDGTEKLYPRGTRVLLKEWYICDPKNTSNGLRYSATEIAKGILEREEKTWGARIVKPGPADNAIYTMLSESSIGAEMGAAGVRFTRSDKRPGSRALGWARMMELFLRAHKEEIEQPPLLFVEDCLHSIRTIPDLPTDPKNPDDCVSDGEDHLGDAIRYAVASDKVNKLSVVSVIGL